MSLQEIYGNRKLTYSGWHRPGSICRYLPSVEDANSLSQIDLDHVLYVEYQDIGCIPLLLIEVAEDVEQVWKPCMVTKNLAMMARLRALCVLYKEAPGTNPDNPNNKDIESFRVRWVAPTEEQSWRTMSPKEYAEFLLEIRNQDAEKARESYLRALRHGVLNVYGFDGLKELPRQ